jgi:hypothetical protein
MGHQLDELAGDVLLARQDVLLREAEAVVRRPVPDLSWLTIRFP